MRRTSRSALVAALAPGLVGAGLLSAAPAASADDGLTVGARSRYVVDAKDEVVHATMTVDLHNVTPDRREGDRIYYYFFNSFSMPVPTGATALRATSNGGTLPVSTTKTEDPSTALAVISFSNLRYGQTRRLELTFDVPGAKHRSKDTTRVGPGFATFVAVGPGDPGDTSVQVVAPSSWSFTSTDEGFETKESGSSTTYTLDESTEDYGIWSVVSFRDPEKTREQTVRVGDLSLTLAGFPDDKPWGTFVGKTVEQGIPSLEALVGEPWPGGLETIREDSSPSLLGYDGWFDPSDDEIVVGEQLDDDLIYHELSHAWLDGTAFIQRWLYEGLAQVAAERAVKDTGGKVWSHPKVSRQDADAIALNTWEQDDGRSSDVNDYTYPASYRVMSDLLGDLDDEQFAAVVGAAVRTESAYDRPGERSTASLTRTSWNSWLDLVETRGGVQDADEVLSRWVLTGAEKKQLPDRAKARKAYAALDEADGDWLPPLGLRAAMTAWRFDDAATVRTAVTDLGEQAVAVQRAGADAGLEVPTTVREAYEKADTDAEYDELATMLPSAATAITAVAGARDVRTADRDPFTALGARVLGVDDRADRAVTALEAGELGRARTAATEVTDRSGWLLPIGVALPLVALLVLGGLGLVGRVLVLRRRRRPVPALTAPPADVAVAPAHEVADPADRTVPGGA